MSEPPNLPWHPIPSSKATCIVHLIQAGGLYIPLDMTLLPSPNEPNTSTTSSDNNQKPPETFYAPDYVFLITHSPSSQTLIFDLGMRKDLENLPPLILKSVLPSFKCEPKSPADILKEHGTTAQQPEAVNAVVFSHMHFDHVGDGGRAGFTAAEMWVGPTSCTYARPGYPVEAKAPTLSETLPVDGSRKIVESWVSDEALKRAGDKRAGLVAEGIRQGKYEAVELKKVEWITLGAFERAYDVFGDGAAYLVDAPGHAAGHQMMLVRTSVAASGDFGADSEDDTFVLLAGDCFHHPDLLHDPRRTARPPYSKSGMHGDPEVAIKTLWRTKAFAEKENVWVVAAHDFSVGESIRPGEKEIEGLVEINGWAEKGWKKGTTGESLKRWK